MNEYLTAGQRAQPEVKAAIQRFRLLPADQRNRPLLYWLLGSGTPPYKMAQGDARYTDNTPVPSQKCSNCPHSFLHHASQTNICDQIRGVIQPGGWCKLWKPIV